MMLAISSTTAQMFVTKSSQNMYIASTAASNTLIFEISSDMFYSATSTVLSNSTANYFILVNFKHMELGITERHHFHCPVCKTTIFNRQPFSLHMQRHLLTTDDCEANSNKSRAGDRNS